MSIAIEDLEDLRSEIQKIHERNNRVEINKAWETSKTRLGAVTGVTYITMVLVFSMLGSTRAIIDALVPTTGYFLSTLSLPFIRRNWERRFK